MTDEELHRFWFEFDEADAHGCRLSSHCGVTGWSERDAVAIVAETYCQRSEIPTPRSTVVDIDVSRFPEALRARLNFGVPVWRGIWYPFITRG